MTHYIDENGQRMRCPLYQQWKTMLQRCFSKNWHNKYPTYANCTVDLQWLYFSKFQQWAESHDWQNKDLDKDILIAGNKHYSPNTCLWVPPDINRLLVDSGAKRGNYPIGVCKLKKAYLARISKYGVCYTIGSFKTPEQAAQAFLNAKANHVIQVANAFTGSLQAALLTIADLIRSGKYYQ